MEGNFVAYYRVSTQRQGNSGLGLEAQREAVLNYLNGGGWKLLQEFTEVETGKGSNALSQRPILKEALEYAKREKAKLIIAKLDRLARNVAFIATLMESKIEFVCADMPEANEVTLQFMAVMAQYESKRISERTKEALQAAKRRGIKLGKVENLQIGCKQKQERSVRFAESVRSTVEALKAKGLSQRAIVLELNRTGVKTSEGKQWTLVALQRVIKKLGL